ncbi:MAG: UDP-N-acetylmuramoyl-L-alanyl-D-glutamate--2,6-diaminopimelate ligase, partial [Clostridia bacterium]|nr:UDP-N-acetylmuramoyl-L-alanyl-D-glutamate--2,6-diaminopimelate ligase [Clostridia bacterium]
MKLSTLLKDVKVKEIINYVDFNVENLVEDSRLASLNSLFFAINGNNLDGHNFIDDAVSNGAKAIISTKKTQCSV